MIGFGWYETWCNLVGMKLSGAVTASMAKAVLASKKQIYYKL